MSSSRFYPNSLPLEVSALDHEEAMRLARSLMNKCINNVETSRSGSLGTIYCGGLGPCVYLRLRLAQQVKSVDPREAQQLLERALAVARDALEYEERRFPRRRFRVSLLEGPWVGAKALVCALLHELDQKEEAPRNARELVTVLERECRALPLAECEVLYGRAGALQVILFLRQQLQDWSIGKELVSALAAIIIKEGLEKSQRYRSNLPLLWEWHDKVYLGAAHGVVGILHTLLHLQGDELNSLEAALQIPVRALIRQTIDGLNDCCFASGNLNSSLKSHGGDRLVHWCHGAPGHVMLLVKAAEFYSDTSYLDQAKEIASNVIWQRGLLRKGVGLCHGISGNCYALLGIARTREPPDNFWVQRASHFTRFEINALEELEMVPDRPYSLYEGAAGLVALILDMINPQNARFPFYEY